MSDPLSPRAAPATAPTVLTGCQMRDTPETRELVAAAGQMLAAAPVSEEKGSEGRATVLTAALIIAEGSTPEARAAICYCNSRRFDGYSRPCPAHPACSACGFVHKGPCPAPAPPPSTGDEAPGPSLDEIAAKAEAYVAMESVAGLRSALRIVAQNVRDAATRASPSPRAQTGTDEGVSEEQLATWERLANEATPGPWAWFGNTAVHSMHLATKHSGRIYVLRFQRWGMRDAQPCFQDREAGIIRPATDFVRYERDYRKDIAAIEHPDARFMAEARAMVPSLLAEVRRLRSAALCRVGSPRAAALAAGRAEDRR
jgi:hypothetical protein